MMVDLYSTMISKHHTWIKHYNLIFQRDCYSCAVSKGNDEYLYYILPDSTGVSFRLGFIAVELAEHLPLPVSAHSSLVSAMKCATEHYHQHFHGVLDMVVKDEI